MDADEAQIARLFPYLHWKGVTLLQFKGQFLIKFTLCEFPGSGLNGLLFFIQLEVQFTNPFFSQYCEVNLFLTRHSPARWA